MAHGLLNVYEIKKNALPSVCNIKPVTKQFLGFSLNSVQMFFLKSHRLRASFVKIDKQWRPTLGRARISTRTFHISWPIWVKFGTRDRHTLPAVCRTNPYGENCTVLRGARHILPYFAHFLSDFQTVPYRQHRQHTQYPQNIIQWQQVS